MTNLRFHEDGSFRVLRVAGIQDDPNVLPNVVRLIREVIRKAGPGLVVFAGDQIRGYDPACIDTLLRCHGEEPDVRVHAVTEVEARLRGIKRRVRNRVDNHPLVMKSDGSNPGAQQITSTASTTSALVYSTTSDLQDVPTTLDELMDETRDKVRRTFTGFLDPVIGAEMPFAATYSNHDFQCGILVGERDGIYREFPSCLNLADSLEPDTFTLPTKAFDGSGCITMSVTMVNSGDYAGKPEESNAQHPAYVVNPRGFDLADPDRCGASSPEAIDWLGAVRSGLGERNGDGEPVPAVAFQHIPPQEFYDYLKKIPAWIPNAVEDARTHAGHCYVLNHEICRPRSRLGETIDYTDENVGEVNALREADGCSTLLYGHDHKNTFVGHAHGIDLGYAPTYGLEYYGPKSRYRDIRLSESHESNPAGYVTHMLTWGDLVGRHSDNEVRVWFEDHCVTDAISMRNELRRPQVSAVLADIMNLGFMTIIRSLVKRR